MIIRVNGNATELAHDVRSVYDLLQLHELDATRVIVEHNGTIIDKVAYTDTPLQHGDLLEIVHFVGGG